MKNAKLLLLGLICGMAITACSKDSYIECTKIKVGTTEYTAGAYARQLVVRYKSDTQFDISIAAPNGGYYTYFFVNYDAANKKPTFPDNAIYYYHSYGSRYGASIQFDKEIGIYETYYKLFISKDKKVIKYEDTDLKPISAPRDKEIQGKASQCVKLQTNGELPNGFYDTNSIVILKTKIEYTYTNINNDELVSYTVKEK